MKTLLIIAGFGISVFAISGIYKNDLSISNKNGISFSDLTWEESLNKAEKENKPIFLDAYASWCGPCKLLKNTTLADEKAGRFFNEQFINVTFDMEKGEGQKLARKFNVSAYPTLVIINPEGEPLAILEGYVKPDKLIKFGKYGLERYRK